MSSSWVVVAVVAVVVVEREVVIPVVAVRGKVGGIAAVVVVVWRESLGVWVLSLVKNPVFSSSFPSSSVVVAAVALLVRLLFLL